MWALWLTVALIRLEVPPPPPPPPPPRQRMATLEAAFVVNNTLLYSYC